MLDGLGSDLRRSVRSLVKAPGFAGAALMTLAIGIGVNAALFGVVYGVLIRPLPFPEPGRLVMLWTGIAAEGVSEAGSSQANVRDWEAENRVLEELATFDPTTLTLTSGGWAEQVSGARVSSSFFPTLGVSPALGRAVSAEDEWERAAVAVLSHGFWTRRFGGSRDVVGRMIELSDTTLEVVGVMPAYFGIPGETTDLCSRRRSHRSGTKPPSGGAPTSGASWAGCGRGSRSVTRARSSGRSPRGSSGCIRPRTPDSA